MNEKLILLNNEKNKFIGIAAHDLANPIGTIYSFSELLLDNQTNKMDQEMEESVSFIRDLSHNTLGVLKNLLNVSVIESGKIELKIEKNNYIEFITKQIIFNQILASKKKINIHLETAQEVILLNFDKTFLSQVVNNLLTNAIKFSFAESDILIKITKDKNNHIYTEVIDQGKGIPEKEKQKLFNYFQKTSTQPTNGEHSTGLGLAIAKQIITLHKGTIGVTTKENEGSNFHYSLPL
ncbi:sensor histidine kinase [Flavobacterium sp.]|uniref:sensor histidine kinase n=1 Tax=Flavobacterium sp. TaxID=239 RepID=UPI003C346B15